LIAIYAYYSYKLQQYSRSSAPTIRATPVQAVAAWAMPAKPRLPGS